jgi:hypothetical protein
LSILRLGSVTALAVDEELEEGEHVRLLVAGPGRSPGAPRGKPRADGTPRKSGTIDLIVAVRYWEVAPRCPACDSPV